MVFLLDQGLPRSTIQHLQNIGLQAVHVGSLGFATATDQRILAMGRDRGAIVVTLDSDFHALLARSNASSPSVIRIRIQGLKGDGVARVIQQVVNERLSYARWESPIDPVDRRHFQRRVYAAAGDTPRHGVNMASRPPNAPKPSSGGESESGSPPPSR